MVKFNGYDPDAVGWAWIAFRALQGDGSLEAVAIAARDLQEKLGDAGPVLHALGEQDIEKAVSSTHLFMIALSEMLDPNGTSEYKIEIKHRWKGKPINRRDRALRGHRAAGMVERLVQDGMKKEAAIAFAKDETGLSRAEIFSWLKQRRIPPGQLAERLGVPEAVKDLLEPYKRGESSQSDE